MTLKIINGIVMCEAYTTLNIVFNVTKINFLMTLLINKFTTIVNPIFF